MPEVLNQNEVDALLEAMGGEDIDLESGDDTATLSGDVTLYDFKRPERVSKDQKVDACGPGWVGSFR